MGRRLLSHLLITLAIFSLTATFFIWVIDATVLNPAHLSKALHDGGVPSAIATIIPNQVSKGNDNSNCNNSQNNQNGQPTNTASGGGDKNGGGNCQQQPKSAEDIAKEADMKAKIATVVTPSYVDEKIQAITTSVIAYMKHGTPDPTIDISDFPANLKASGIDVGDDANKNFGTPIKLNNNGALSVLPKAYKTFSLVKIAGIVLFVLLLLSEWFVAAKGDKLHRIGRIFLHAGLWYTLYWVVLVVVPSHVLPTIKDKIKADSTVNPLIDAVTKSVQHLFSVYFLAFAIVCWFIAIALYAVRHMQRHVDKIQAVPAMKPIRKPAISNKR